MDEKTVRDALRRHLTARGRPRHMPVPGGIRFEEGGGLHFAPDAIVLDVLTEISLARRRPRRVGPLADGASGAGSPEAPSQDGAARDGTAKDGAVRDDPRDGSDA